MHDHLMKVRQSLAFAVFQMLSSARREWEDGRKEEKEGRRGEGREGRRKKLAFQTGPRQLDGTTPSTEGEGS